MSMLLKINLRNLKLSGKKAELVARVFPECELGISVCLTTVQRTSNTEDEKTRLLKMPESLLPDLLLLKKMVGLGKPRVCSLDLLYL